MKQSFLLTLFLLLSIVFSFGQTYIENRVSIFTNTLEAQNSFRVDTITVTKGLNTVHLKADSALVNNGIKTKNLTVDNVKVNNTLTANTISANNFNFTNSLDLSGSDLRVGNHATPSNTNFILRYNNGSNLGAMFAFFKGDGVPANTIRDATITKISGKPLTLSTDAAESIVLNTAGADRLTVGGNGNVGIGALPTASDKLNVDGSFRVTGNVGIGSNPTTDKLNVDGTLKVTGNVGIGTNPSAADKLNIAGNMKISGSEPTYRAEGAYPTLDLDGGINTYPRIYFSGADEAGVQAKNFTTLTGEGGGFRIKTSGALVSELLGTQASTVTKKLHVYQAENWAGWAEIASKGLYGGAAYANAIDFASGTRLKIEQNQYTGGLLMGYANTVYPLRSNYVAAAIKSQYMGTDINTAGQHKFDVMFGINSDGNGAFSFDPREVMRMKDDGTVKINKGLTINTNLPLTGDTKLLVDGRILSTNVTVALTSNWPDYVFEKNFNLTPLSKVKQFIEKNGHLPNVPSAAEVKKDGIDLGTMNAKLLEKIEELTLYLINQQKQIDELKKEMQSMKKQ